MADCNNTCLYCDELADNCDCDWEALKREDELREADAAYARGTPDCDGYCVPICSYCLATPPPGEDNVLPARAIC